MLTCSSTLICSCILWQVSTFTTVSCQYNNCCIRIIFCLIDHFLCVSIDGWFIRIIITTYHCHHICFLFFCVCIIIKSFQVFIHRNSGIFKAFIESYVILVASRAGTSSSKVNVYGTVAKHIYLFIGKRKYIILILK